MPDQNPSIHPTSANEGKAHLDALLDDALTKTFPASDPVALDFDDSISGSMTVTLSDILAQAVLSARSDAIIAADRQGIIRFWNPGAERIFGFSEADALGQSLDIIIPERLRQRHWEGYDRAMATGQSRYGDSDILAVPAMQKDGTPLSIEFTVMMLRDRDNQIIGIAALLRDVTKRFEEVRALKRQLAAKT
jgi:PAS domain S-box-containing protein